MSCFLGGFCEFTSLHLWISNLRFFQEDLVENEKKKEFFSLSPPSPIVSLSYLTCDPLFKIATFDFYRWSLGDHPLNRGLSSWRASSSHRSGRGYYPKKILRSMFYLTFPMTWRRWLVELKTLSSFSSLRRALNNSSSWPIMKHLLELPCVQRWLPKRRPRKSFYILYGVLESS